MVDPKEKLPAEELADEIENEVPSEEFVDDDDDDYDDYDDYDEDDEEFD